MKTLHKNIHKQCGQQVKRPVNNQTIDLECTSSLVKGYVGGGKHL